MSNKFKDVSLDDVYADPTKFGLPTFDEFVKKPELLLGRDDEAFSEVEKGSTNLNRLVNKHVYEIEGYKCKTLDEVEKVAKSMGINIRELDYRPQIVPNTSGKYSIKVTFVSKKEREKRKLWG